MKPNPNPTDTPAPRLQAAGHATTDPPLSSHALHPALHPAWLLAWVLAWVARGALLLACDLGLTAPARAACRAVPAAYPTIQQAIDAAAPGDTVLVAPGTYRENIDFTGKDLLVTSHFLHDADYAFVRRTVIDGSEPASPDTASCAVFVSGETQAAVLQGFTLTGGAGTRWVDPQFPAYTWRGGGGVFCFQASPTIRFNRITGNHVSGEGVSGAQAGGLLVYGGNARFLHNTVVANQAGYGGGIVVDYAGALIRNNLIVRNRSVASYGGGGIWTIGVAPDPILLENNVLARNQAAERAGAIYVWSSQITARGNILWENEQAQGGPIFTTGGGTLAITYSDIEGGYAGEGNFDQEPAFADTLAWMLAPGSPCIDAGDPGAAHEDPEDPEHPGQAAWPAQGTLRNDVGAYGGPGCTCFEPGVSAIAPGCPGQNTSQRESRLVPASANPARDRVTLRLAGPLGEPVHVQVIDPRGAIVRGFAAGPWEAGEPVIHWDGRDAQGHRVCDGVYLLRLRTASGRCGRARVVLLH